MVRARGEDQVEGGRVRVRYGVRGKGLDLPLSNILP